MIIKLFQGVPVLPVPSSDIESTHRGCENLK